MPWRRPYDDVVGIKWYGPVDNYDNRNMMRNMTFFVSAAYTFANREPIASTACARNWAPDPSTIWTVTTKKTLPNYIW